MGVIGTGKSNFISKCCERHVPIGHSLQPCNLPLSSVNANCCEIYPGTSTIRAYLCDIDAATTAYLIDTLGFDDTHRSDTEVLGQLAKWLADTYKGGIQLSGIIYLHRISDLRMQGSAKKHPLTFKKLCGDDALKNVILATTKWDRVSKQKGTARERELRSTEEFWGWMVSQGSKVYRHTGTPGDSCVHCELTDEENMQKIEIPR